MSEPIPDPPGSAGKWLEIFRKMNEYNLWPAALALATGVLYWWSLGQAKLDRDAAALALAAANARTQAALQECRSSGIVEGRKTREEVRAKAEDLKRELQPAQ